MSDAKRAVDYLAARCDYAREDDAQGFNGSDAGFGHELAALAFEAWTEVDRVAARVMLQKYRGQLAAVGVDPRRLPREAVVTATPGASTPRELDAAERAIASKHRKAKTSEKAAAKRHTDAIEKAAASSAIRIDGSEFLVTFPYRAETVAACKAIPGRKRFDAGALGWRLRIDDVDPSGLLDFLERFKFTIGDDIRAKLVELIKHPRPKASVASPAPGASAPRTVTLAPGGLVFRVTFPYDETTIGILRAKVPAAKWNKVERVWEVPVRAASAEGLGVFLASRTEFGASPEVRARIAAAMAGTRDAIEASRAAVADQAFVARLTAAIPYGLKPFDFQAAGVSYALRTERLIIGDEMGLGKTIQAILTVVLGDAWPVVVVCPANLVYNWFREFRKWAPGRTISVLQGGRMGAYRADILIVNYELLTQRRAPGAPKRQKRDAVPLSRHALGIIEAAPKAVIFDEIHYLKNHAALRTLAARKVADAARFRIGLSGTAILNAPGELIAPLSVIGRLNDLGGYHYFVNRFCDGDARKGSSHLQELNAKLRGTCYIRREKSQVLTDLPEKTWTRVELPIDNREEYNRVAADVIKWASQRAASNARFLETLDAELAELRRRLIVDGMAPAAADAAVAMARENRIVQRGREARETAARAEGLVKIEALKRTAVAGKMAAVREWISEFCTEQKLITFATHVDVQHAVAAMVPGSVHIFGDDEKDARDEAVRRFQAEPRETCPQLVTSLKAGGVGWTGTAASNVAFVEPGWTPGEMDQAIDRAHRIGQRDAVTGYELVAKDTIEETIYDLIASKRAVVEATLVGGEDVKRASVLDDLIRAVVGSAPRLVGASDVEGDVVEIGADGVAHPAALGPEL